MYILYAVLYTLISPLFVLRLWFKARHNPAYRKRVAERFSLSLYGEKADVWLHLVSLGEVVAATGLIERLLLTKKTVLITTMTPSGAMQVERQFANRVMHRYVPYDIPMAVKRFVRYYQPRLAIILETELWPSLIIETHRAGITLLLCSACLSPDSYRGYQKIRFFMKRLLACVQGIYAQTSEDAERFIAIGADPRKVEVVGNIKLQLHALPKPNPEQLSLKSHWGKDRIVIIAASTHHDEEAKILDAWPSFLEKHHDALLVIAPRHPERFALVRDMIQERGLNLSARSEQQAPSRQIQVFLLDTLGELRSFYALCDYAFVGGSLAPIGGHNVLEPISLGAASFVGPHVSTQPICQPLAEQGVIDIIPSAEALLDAIDRLIQAPAEKEKRVAEGKAFIEAQQGVLDSYVKHCLDCLS